VRGVLSHLPNGGSEAARHVQIRQQGEVLQPRVAAPILATTKYGEVPVLDSVATHDDEEGRVTVFVVNRTAFEAELPPASWSMFILDVS
jgi:alpha-L-arabinofuranosidase